MTAERESPYELIESTPHLAAFMEKVAGCPVLAVDTESNSLHNYVERVSLIQLTGRQADGALHHAIVDPLAEVDVHLLGPMLADPEVVVIFHGADYDVVSLKRDYGFAITNVYDTMIAARAAGMERFGLADLVNGYFGVTLNKKFQKHDWAARPLSQEALDYAHLDTRYLPEIMDRLRDEVKRHDRCDMVAEECRLAESREWTQRPQDGNAFISMKGASRLPEKSQRVLREVYRLREKLAEQRDLPPFKVMGNEAMLNIARAMPTDARSLQNAIGGRSRMLKRYGAELLDAVAAGLVSTEELPKPEKKGSGRRFSREDDALFNRLREWRNRRAKEEGVEPAVVVNNTVLQEVSAHRPADAEAVAQVPGIREWQIRRYAGDLARQVAEFEQQS